MSRMWKRFEPKSWWGSGLGPYQCCMLYGAIRTFHTILFRAFGPIPKPFGPYHARWDTDVTFCFCRLSEYYRRPVTQPRVDYWLYLCQIKRIDGHPSMHSYLVKKWQIIYWNKNSKYLNISRKHHFLWNYYQGNLSPQSGWQLIHFLSGKPLKIVTDYTSKSDTFDCFLIGKGTSNTIFASKALSWDRYGVV